MSIATVITRGYGSFGSISAVILRGYFSSTPAPTITPDTHDLPRRVTEDYKKHLKKRQQALEERQEEKRAEAEKLRRQIDEARGIFTPEGQEVSDEPTLGEIKNEVTGTIYVDKMPQLLDELSKVGENLRLLEEHRQAVMREYRKRKDEDDMQIILKALNFFN